MTKSIVVELTKDTPDVDAMLIGITHVHAYCIEHDKTIATFIPPLSFSKILQWWHERFDEVNAGTKRIWVELALISERKQQIESPFKENELKPIRPAQDSEQDYEVAGVVALQKPTTETGPFRGEVHKLLVSPNHRQKGIAKRLMAQLEREALKEGRFNLMLDTEVGSPAEQVYPRLGYIRVGMVPEYGYSPRDGKLMDEVWFYKDLRKGTL